MGTSHSSSNPSVDTSKSRKWHIRTQLSSFTNSLVLVNTLSAFSPTWLWLVTDGTRLAPTISLFVHPDPHTNVTSTECIDPPPYDAKTIACLWVSHHQRLRWGYACKHACVCIVCMCVYMYVLACGMCMSMEFHAKGRWKLIKCSFSCIQFKLYIFCQRWVSSDGIHILTQSITTPCHLLNACKDFDNQSLEEVTECHGEFFIDYGTKLFSCARTASHLSARASHRPAFLPPVYRVHRNSWFNCNVSEMWKLLSLSSVLFPLYSFLHLSPFPFLSLPTSFPLSPLDHQFAFFSLSVFLSPSPFLSELYLHTLLSCSLICLDLIIFSSGVSLAYLQP